jgi:hypothetical protein
MPVSGLHRQVASIALAAAAEHGFALGGGNALLAHGLTTRPTLDVDLFTDQEHGVEAATGAVERALAAAGLPAERQDDTAGLADLFPGMGQGLAEWIVTAPGGEQTVLQMAYFDRSRAPVVMEIGPTSAGRPRTRPVAGHAPHPLPRWTAAISDPRIPSPSRHDSAFGARSSDR